MTKLIQTTAIAAAILTAGPAMAVTIDFEGVAQGIYDAGTDFSGLSFDMDIQVGEFAFLDGPATDGSIARQFVKPFGAIRGRSISGMFTSSVSSLRLGAGDSSGDIDNITLTGFDQNGAVVDTDSFSGPASGFLDISGPGIVSFFLDISAGVAANQPGSSGFDNITFEFENLAPVPLPASLPLLALGLGGLAYMRRKR